MGLKAYIDSCLVIYLVEEHPLFSPILEAKIAKFSDLELVTSSLTEMECLIIPFRNQN